NEQLVLCSTSPFLISPFHFFANIGQSTSVALFPNLFFATSSLLKEVSKCIFKLKNLFLCKNKKRCIHSSVLFLSFSICCLQELAQYLLLSLLPRFHRARPSTSLDKN